MCILKQSIETPKLSAAGLGVWQDMCGWECGRGPVFG